MKKTFVAAAILSAIAAIIIRLTVFTEDCNLLVMAMTYAVLLIAFSAVGYLLHVLTRRS